MELIECETVAENDLFQADKDGSAESVPKFSANLCRVCESNKLEKFWEVLHLNNKL